MNYTLFGSVKFICVTYIFLQEILIYFLYIFVSIMGMKTKPYFSIKILKEWLFLSYPIANLSISICLSSSSVSDSIMHVNIRDINLLLALFKHSYHNRHAYLRIGNNFGMTMTLHTGFKNSLQFVPSLGTYFFLHTLNKLNSNT